MLTVNECTFMFFLTSVEKTTLIPAVWSSPHVSSGYPGKLSVGLEVFTEQPEILRETRSSSCSKTSTPPQQECSLCTKVRHPPSAANYVCFIEQQVLNCMYLIFADIFMSVEFEESHM